MPNPRPQTSRVWTWDDHLDNEQLFQRAADSRTWCRLARLIGLRGRELQALLGRFLDDRIAAALRARPQLLIDQLTNPAAAGELRNVIGDLMVDDIAAMVQMLTTKGSNDDTGDPEETPGSGEPDAAYEQRDIYGTETEVDEAEEA